MPARILAAVLLLSCALPLRAPASEPDPFSLDGHVVEVDGTSPDEARAELFPVPSEYQSGLLRLRTQPPPAPAATSRIDGRGRFSLQVPRPGAWRVVVRAHGRVPMQIGPLLLVEPEELPTLVLPLDVECAVRVVSSDGRSVAEAWVIVTGEDENGDPIRTVQGWRPDFRIGRTAEDGSLTLPRLPDEQLRLTVHAPGRGADERSGFEQGTVRLVAAAPPNTVSLRVVDSDGEPVPKVLVREGPELWPAGITDDEGIARIVPSGGASRRLLLVAPDGRRTLHEPTTESRDTEETIVLLPLVQVRGKVLDARSRSGIGGATLWLTGHWTTAVRTDRRGGYSVSLPATTTTASLRVKAPGFLPARVLLTSAEIAAGRSPAVALRLASVVSGSVLGPERRPIPGAVIETLHASNLGPRTFSRSDPIADRTFTGAEGRFRLHQLAAGETYELRVREEGYFPSAVEVTPRSPGKTDPPLLIQLRRSCGLHGSVLNAEGAPMGDVEVIARAARRVAPAASRSGPDTPDSAIVSRSDAAGRFLVARPPAAEIDLEIAKRGFAPALRRNLRIDERCRGSWDVGPIVLRAGATLTGRVLGLDGEAIADAEIFRVEGVPPRTTWARALRDREPVGTTDPRGGFVLEDLPEAAPVDLLIRASGFLVAAARGVRPPVEEGLIVVLEPARSLRGRVVDESGAGIPDARVDLDWQRTLEDDPRERSVGEPILRSARSDDSGTFEIRDVPAGVISLRAKAVGFVPTPDRKIDLADASSAAEVVVTLRRGGRLEGRITTDLGEPVGGVRVSVSEHTVLSDAEGIYQLDGAPLGNQELHVFHPHYPEQLREIQIEAGVNLLDLELEAGFAVAGRVVDETGRPVTNASVSLTPHERPGRRIHQGRSDDLGEFVLQPVQRGWYELRADAEGYAAGGSPGPLVVDDRDPEEVEVVLRTGATITGWVVGLPPDEIALVTVVILDPHGASRPVHVDAEGRFEVRELPVGDWLLRASLWNGQRTAEARVPVASADDWVRRDLEFGQRLTLSGRVSLADEPLPRSAVTLRGERFDTERGISTGWDGTFVFDDLEPDRYWIGVRNAERFVVHNDTFDLVENTHLEIRIETASVSGTIVDESDRAAIADALIALRPLQGPEALFTEASQADGTFRVFHLPPGRYRVSASARGHAPVEREIAVAAGDQVEDLELSLARTEGLRIVLTTTSGDVPALLHFLALDPAGAPVLAGSFPPDPSGHVDISTMPAGEWHLTLGAPGASTRTVATTVPGEPLHVSLASAGDLHVRIPELTRENVVATVRLLTQEGKTFWTLGPGGVAASSWRLQGGDGLVEGVPAGTWVVVAETSAGRSWSGAVTTSGSGRSTILLE